MEQAITVIAEGYVYGVGQNITVIASPLWEGLAMGMLITGFFIIMSDFFLSVMGGAV